VTELASRKLRKARQIRLLLKLPMKKCCLNGPEEPMPLLNFALIRKKETLFLIVEDFS
jgi:hypothetical protein